MFLYICFIKQFKPNIMKNILKNSLFILVALITSLVLMGIVYLFFSFYCWDLNAGNWKEATRGFCSVICFIIFIASICLIFEIS